MKELVEAKLKEAQTQQAQWQQRLAQAQEQVVRWDAVRLACEELLARRHEEDGERGEKSPGA